MDRGQPKNERGNIAESDAIKRLESDGWTVHTRGWPDLLCVKDGAVKFVEVKSRSDYVRPAQKAVMDILKSLGLSVEVMKMRRTGVIPKTIRDISPTQPKLTKIQLVLSRARGEVQVFRRGHFVFVSAPYSPEFRDGANGLKGRFRPKSAVWRFKEVHSKQLMELLLSIYGSDAIKSGIPAASES